MSVRGDHGFSQLSGDDSVGSPSLGRNKQYATVALAKGRNRRPSTVKLFANSSNPFADTTPAMPAVSAQRDDTELDKRKGLVDEQENSTYDAQNNGGKPLSREHEMLMQYRAKEAALSKAWSAQQPFQYLSAVDHFNASVGGSSIAGGAGMRSRNEDRLSPSEWEQKAQTYNDWELGMLHKLAKVAELLLTPETAMMDPKKVEQRLDEIAKQEATERVRVSTKTAEPEQPPPPSLLEGDSSLRRQPSGDLNEAGSGNRRRSPRSPETQRKNRGSWSAKMAAAKKKSLERKKGQDTLSQLREAEGGLPAVTMSGAELESSASSLFSIWNKDGSQATSPDKSSLGGTPSGSPVVTRKPTGSGDVTPSKGTPGQSRKSGRFTSITMRPKRSSSSLSKDDIPDEEAFPGVLSRTADPASFLELARKGKSKTDAADDSPVSEEVVSSSSVPDMSSISHIATPTLTKRSSGRTSQAKPDLGLKLSFLTQSRRSSAKLTKAESPPMTIPDAQTLATSPSSMNNGVSSPPNTSLTSSSGSVGTVSGASTPLKSPKSKRFSHMFSRRSDTPPSPADKPSSPVSPRPPELSSQPPTPQLKKTVTSTPGTPVTQTSPRKSGGSNASSPTFSPKNGLKSPSPRTSVPRMQIPGFARRKTVSPRSMGDQIQQAQQHAANAVAAAVVTSTSASPPPSARELTVDDGAMEALNNLIGKLEPSPRPEEESL